LTAVLAVRALWLAARYLTHTGGVMRFHVESAVLAFVVVGVITAVVDRAEAAAAVVPGQYPIWTWPVWCLGALLLYWPALTLGLLSDDFILADRGVNFRLSAFNAESFRPIPIALWGVLLRLGGGATAIHLVNVLAHGTNAFLASRIARPFVASAGLATLGGLLVLASPVGPEAVAWSSGVFDVLATTLVLTTLLIARGYGAEPTYQRRLAFMLTAFAALLSKETAAIAAPLVVVDALTSGAPSRKLWVDTSIVAAVTAVAIGARLVFGSSLARQPITKYLIQKWIFGTFGGLAVPWHIDVMRQRPLVPIGGMLAVLSVLTFFLLRRQTTAAIRVALFGAFWCLLATLPPITMFFIAPDLQGTRYLYLASVGYAVMLLALASAGGARSFVAGSIPKAMLVVLVMLGMAGVRWHLEPWLEAAALRDRVVMAARSVTRERGCETATFVDAPDAARGAYIFRNGLSEALGMRLPQSHDARCVFRWDGQQFVQ
jgi:hypothetical protein